MAVIHLLDKSVYELIAAGEVIERPSSVVKELLENSIDAGSTNITVEIKNGGRSYIRVTDNGCGIAPEDIPLAFMRHATSKIQYKDDLSAIYTLGFRGEALASVCAVSRIDILTKCKPDEFGIHCSLEGGEETCYEQSGCPDGTTITVRDLFYNVPARLKFLKKDVSEGNSVANIVSKIALSHPEISFKFIRDNKTELVTSGDGRLISAIYSVLGKEFHGSVIPVDYSLNGVSVRGYVTKPLMAKANRAFQNFFVNNRYVKSVTCMVALEEAYRNEIMTGKFPGCVLMITLDPANLDVNVHPAKVEIRFSDEKPVYDAVYFAVKNSLMTFDSPMEAEVSFKEEPQRKKQLSLEEIYKKPEKPIEQLSFSSSPAIFETSPMMKVTADIYGAPPPRKPADPPDVSGTTQRADAKLRYKYIPAERSEKTPAEFSKPADEPQPASDGGITVIGEVFKTYIVAQQGSEMYLIDKHAAHERYNFERLRSGAVSVDSQIVITPFKVRLSYDGHTAVSDNIKLLERFGFKLEAAEPPEVTVYGVPILLSDEDPADLLTRIADSLAEGKKSGGSEVYDDLYHSVACKASIKANSESSAEELLKLAELVINDNIRYCPHGRPALVKFTKSELEKLFKRTV